MKKYVITLLAVFAVVATSWWLFTQPKKALVVSALWMPAYPEWMKDFPMHVPGVNDEEGIVYRIYYEWDGVCDDLPWWIITDSLDGTWRVIEAAGTEDYSHDPEDNAPFTDRWIDGGFRRVRRTRVQALQKALFGTDHAFSREKVAMKAVMDLIRLQESFVEQKKDLFDEMSAHVKANPEYGVFAPSSRDHFDEMFRKVHEQYLAEKAAKANAPVSSD